MKFKKNFLREEAKRQGLSLKAISKRAGLKYENIFAIGKRGSIPSSLRLAKIAQALGVRMESFFEDMEDVEDRREKPYLICYKAMTKKGFKINGCSSYSIRKLTTKELEKITDDILKNEEDLFSLVLTNVIKLDD